MTNDKAVLKANRELDAEMKKQINMIYPVFAHVFWYEYGWKKLRIMRVFITSQEVWEECAAYSTEKSMLEMLEEETGIEISIPGKKSYHELAYLGSSAWDGKPPTKMQLLYIRQKQKEWLAPMLLACMCLSLHRYYGYGPERIARFVESVQTIRFDRGTKEKNYRDLLEGTTIELNEITQTACMSEKNNKETKKRTMLHRLHP